MMTKTRINWIRTIIRRIVRPIDKKDTSLQFSPAMVIIFSGYLQTTL
jgi:hypothetical protein